MRTKRKAFYTFGAFWSKPFQTENNLHNSTSHSSSSKKSKIEFRNLTFKLTMVAVKLDLELILKMKSGRCVKKEINGTSS